MGSKCSGSYADIFMGKLEGSKIYPLINDKHLAYCRFKDDIFMIWTHGEEALLEFFDIINQAHPSIKFDCKYSSTEINFLDVLIRIDPSGRLLASLYKKPTDRNAYLHFNSYHPARLIQNIPYGQFLRCKKICTTPQDADKAMTELEDKFRQRGYPASNTKKQRDRTKDLARNSLLQDKEKSQERRTPFSTTYNTNHPEISKIINRHWPILHTNRELAKTFQNRPVMAYRRNKNLRDLIGQVHLSRNKKVIPRKRPRITGSSACLSRANNLCCRHTVSTKTFTSANTGETLTILHNMNCKSRFCIYLGHCTLCPKSQYVGKSEPEAHLRYNTHRRDVHGPLGGPFDKHFLQAGHRFNDHARFTLLEQINPKGKTASEIRTLMEDREDYWMTRLKTITPDGHNDHLNSALRQNIHVITQ